MKYNQLKEYHMLDLVTRLNCARTRDNIAFEWFQKKTLSARTLCLSEPQLTRV